jgi:peroxiredoxin Q/BCP
MPLIVGQDAPDFDVVASDGRQLKLSELKGKKNVVLYFYPGDFTPVCTKETCSFRDMYSDLVSKDTEVIGVSVDDDASHKKFAAKHSVGFPLVADPQMKLARLYGVMDGPLGLVREIFGKARRVTYVIDKKGKIAAVLTGELMASKHTEGVQAVIDNLVKSA